MPKKIIYLPYFVEIDTDAPAPYNSVSGRLLNYQDLAVNISTNLVECFCIDLEYNDTKELTMSKLAEEFAKVTPFMLMQVTFIKANGDERELTGYRVHNHTNALGRSSVVDLNIKDKNNNIRLVDHRNLKEFIYNNTRYQLAA